MSQTENTAGSRHKVMICEDEFIVALDLKLMLEDFGFEVLGPFSEVSAASEFVKDTCPDVALLDVNLRDGQVFPLADTLAEKGVPMVFHSGHVDDSEIRERYPEAASCKKPVNTEGLKTALFQSVA